MQVIGNDSSLQLSIEQGIPYNTISSFMLSILRRMWTTWTESKGEEQKIIWGLENIAEEDRLEELGYLV